MGDKEGVELPLLQAVRLGVREAEGVAVPAPAPALVVAQGLGVGEREAVTVREEHALGVEEWLCVAEGDTVPVLQVLTVKVPVGVGEREGEDVAEVQWVVDDVEVAQGEGVEERVGEVLLLAHLEGLAVALVVVLGESVGVPLGHWEALAEGEELGGVEEGEREGVAEREGLWEPEPLPVTVAVAQGEMLSEAVGEALRLPLTEPVPVTEGVSVAVMLAEWEVEGQGDGVRVLEAELVTESVADEEEEKDWVTLLVPQAVVEGVVEGVRLIIPLPLLHSVALPH